MAPKVTTADRTDALLRDRATYRLLDYRPRFSSALAGPAAAALGVAATTALLHLLPGARHIANVSMVYLLVVAGTAVAFGSGSAVLASLLAVLAFDWFFVEPRHTFRVGDPAEWIALFTFLFTAVGTGQLTSLLRAQAAEARHRGQEIAALAEATWAVASQVDRDRALAEVLRRLVEVAPVRRAAILAPNEAGKLACLTSCPMTVGPEPTPDSPGIRIPLTAEERNLGILLLEPEAELAFSARERQVIQSLAGHAAIVLERDRLVRAEADARALAEADRLKTALLSMVSHDFRSPLTSIKAAVTALLQEDTNWDPATQRELLRGVDQETDRLNGMVGNILALSRLEADAWRPRIELTLISELVGVALGFLSPEMSQRISVTLADALPEAPLDPVQMAQVLRNLVENALKYSPTGSPVELAAELEGDRLLLEVRDRGMGLSPGEEQRVFEPFYRAPHLQETSVPGIGIGLAVCRGLVEAHHGTLSACARSGGGTVFRVLLPLTAESR